MPRCQLGIRCQPPATLATEMGPSALDQIVVAFSQHGPAWTATLLGYAVELFVALATIQLVLKIGFWLAQRVEMPELLALIVQETVILGFWFWFMKNSTQFLKAIVDGFGQIANNASIATGGTRNFSPSDIFQGGIDLAGVVWQGLSLMNPGMSILLVLAGIIALLCFALIAAMMVEVLVESALVSFAGVLMMGLASSSYTREYAYAQVRYAMSVGVKRFVLQLLVGVFETIVNGWVAGVSAGTMALNWTNLGLMIGVPIVMLRLVFKVPQMAQDIMNGAIGHTHGGLISTGAGVGGAVGGAVLTGAGAGAAGVAAFRLAGRQMQQNLQGAQGQGGTAGGNSPAPNRISQAAMMTGYAARNLAGSAAADVGRRLTGQYSANHGYRGWRMASDMNRQGRTIQDQQGSNP